MIPSGACPVGVDENVPAEAITVHSRWLNEYTQAFRDSQEATVSALLDTHLLTDYGTTDYLTVVGMWIANPADPLLLNGDWGYGHAALSLSELQTMQGAGATDAQIIARGEELKAKWYVREAGARCQGLGGHDPVEEWLNPAMWYEDSRLDYWTPFLFIDWFTGNL